MTIDKFSAAALKDLHHALGGMISQHRQLFDVGTRHGMDLSKYLLGTIVWNKSLGKPSGPKPSDGFNVRLRATTDVPGGDARGGPTHAYHPYIDSHPGKWDDSDADHYLVHFLPRIPSATQFDLHVTIADGVTWVDEARNAVRGGHYMG